MNICHNVSVLWPNGWTDQDETWHAGRPRPWPYCVRWGPSSPQGGGAIPQFSAHIYCDQIYSWMNQDGTNWYEGLGPGDFVLDGDPAPLHKKGAEPPPQYSAHVSTVANIPVLTPRCTSAIADFHPGSTFNLEPLLPTRQTPRTPKFHSRRPAFDRGRRTRPKNPQQPKTLHMYEPHRKSKQ